MMRTAGRIRTEILTSQAPGRITTMRAKLLVLTLVFAAAALAGDHNFPYVFKRGGGSITRVNGSLEQFTRIKRRFTGDYIWARVQGGEFLIRDQAVLAEGERLFAPVRELEPAARAAEERLRPLEEKADRLSDDESDDHEDELKALEPALEAAAKEVERIDDEMERREAIAEKKFEQIVMAAIKAGKAERVK